MKLLLTVLAFAVLINLFPSFPAARTWYVKPDGTGDVPTIQAAVDSAGVGDLILLAAGTYTWAGQGTGDDYAMIRFMRGVTGFEIRSESGPDVTILNAQWKGRVMYIQAENEITINGFTITGGRASVSYDAGGGIIGHLSPPTIKNCIFTGNTAQQGGGLWYGGVSSLKLENCRFYGNTATYGGGICLVNSSGNTVIDGCAIYDNTASRKGGGIFVYRYKVELNRCAVYSNSAIEMGGGLYCESIEPSTVKACTFARNIAEEGGGINLFYNSQLDIRRSIVAFNRDGAAFYLGSGCTMEISCCDVFGNTGGDSLPPGSIDKGGNFSLNPEFCGIQGSNNYYLQSDSPCTRFNHPDGFLCGLIGAYGTGCGTTPVEDNTWSKVKKLYRD